MSSIKLTLSAGALEQIQALAATAERPVATVAAQMVEHGIAEAEKTGRIATTALPTATANQQLGPEISAPWIEPRPAEEREQWRADAWANILALHARYPKQLSHLQDGWWRDSSRLETLSALAVWRANIDQMGIDPREELAFQAHLADLARIIQQEGGGISKAWKPTQTQPTDWTPGASLPGVDAAEPADATAPGE